MEIFYDYLQSILQYDGETIPSDNYDLALDIMPTEDGEVSGLITTLVTKLDVCSGFVRMTRPTWYLNSSVSNHLPTSVRPISYLPLPSMLTNLVRRASIRGIVLVGSLCWVRFQILALIFAL